MTLFRGAPFNSLNRLASPQDGKLWDRRRYIHFYGEAFSNGRVNYKFDVLAGDQPPTVTDGYGQWANVQMPLRTGMVVYTGRNPIAMQIPVRFMLFDKYGSWLVDDSAGLMVEEQIQILEWMAGEGINTGPSPLVWLSSYDSGGATTGLIPFEYQPGTPNVPKVFNDATYSPNWVITALAWDTAPIKTPNGLRIRQDATVTATMYQAPAGSAQRNTPRPKSSVFVSRPGADTALKIARAVPGEDPPKLAQAIVEMAQNKKLHLRGINQTIKHGRRVTVPSSTVANQ
jgi:hypothetical protein